MTIKVAHLITRFIIGGAQENTLFTVEGLSEKPEMDVWLISGPSLGPEGDLSYGIKKNKKYKVHHINLMRRAINPLFDCVAFIQIFNLFRKEKFDVVHTHSSKAGIIGRFAARAAGVPLIIHTIHGLPFHPYQPEWLNLFYKFLERLAACCTDKIVSVADIMTDKAVAAGIGKPDKFVTIRSGMEIEDFEKAASKANIVREEFGINKKEVVVGKVARLFPLKGHKYFIKAAVEVSRRNDNVRFLLVGDGMLREELETKVQELGLEKKFIFAGLVKPDEIPKMISAMDIVVHASLREGLAKVLVQALAEGKPVVSFDIDGAREVVRTGVNGFLVDPDDEEGFVQSVVTLVEDPVLRGKLGKTGYDILDPSFRKDVMVKLIEKLYKEMLETN
ncbi:MAG: glycosyltransferase family 4 protein [Candidatus Theseobacter exili]|nr:glycosyltransferase family 4 protein [Candidatus Theseobacter exili]